VLEQDIVIVANLETTPVKWKKSIKIKEKNLKPDSKIIMCSRILHNNVIDQVLAVWFDV